MIRLFVAIIFGCFFLNVSLCVGQQAKKINPAGLDVANVVVVEATGCEAFAKLIYDCTEVWLKDAGFAPRCRVVSVEVREHGANSSIYIG